MRQRSVLVVDDSVVTRMSLSRALTNEGYDVAAVNGGNEAIAWMMRHPRADVIITDLHMPQMDDLHLILAIRASRTYHDCPIFVLTSGAPEDEKQLVRQAGATAWIVKPFDTAKLVTAIERVVH